MSEWSPFPRRLFLKGIAGATALTAQVGLAEGNQGVYINERESLVELGNRHLELVIRRDNGGIQQIRDRDTGAKIRETGTAIPASNWGLTFYHSEYTSLLTSSFRAPSPTIKRDSDNHQKRLIIEWENPTLTSPTDGPITETFDATISVEITLQNDDKLSYWNLSIENDSNYAVKSVSCPQITNIQPLDEDGADSLIVPFHMGRKFPDPTTLDYGTVHHYPSGNGTMQFNAYTSPNGGFYTDARDSSGHAKQFEWNPQPTSDKNRLAYRCRHFVPRKRGRNVTLPYPTTFGVLRGDWYDAATRYRQWVTSEGPLENTQPDIPDWGLEKGITYQIQSYTRFNQVQEDVEFDQVVDWAVNMQDRLGTSLVLKWWGWGKHGFPAAGDWFPPKDGVEAFRNTIAQLREAGIETDVFITLVYLLRQSDYWQENRSQAENWLIRTRDGEPRTHEGPRGMEIYKVETTQEGWQRYIRETLARLVDAGAKELQLDGFPWQGVPSCFDETHSHPIGRGGNWYPQSAKTDLKEIYSRFSEQRPDLILGGEGISEFYLPEMSVHNTRDVQAEVHDPAVDRGDSEVIPLLQYTLGEYYFTRGQLTTPPSTVSDQREMLRFWIGRSFVLGMLLQFHFPAPLSSPHVDDPMLDYIGRVGRARETYANRFLARGTMLRKPTFGSETVSLQGRGSDWTATTDKLHGSAWKAPTGESGLVFTNVGKDRSHSVVDIDSQPFDVDSSPRLIFSVTNGEYSIVSRREESVSTVTIDLSPEDVQLVVLEEATAKRQQALAAIVQAQTKVDTPTEEDTLTAAKRAFEANDLAVALTKAKEVLQEPADSPSPTARNQDSRTSASDSTAHGTDQSPTSARSSPPTETEAEAPGFTIGTGIAGLLGGLLGWWRKPTTDDSEEDS